MHRARSGRSRVQSFCPCGGGVCRVCHLPGVDMFAHLEAPRTLYRHDQWAPFPVSLSSPEKWWWWWWFLGAGGGGLSGDPIRSPPRVTLLELKVLLVPLPLLKGFRHPVPRIGNRDQLTYFQWSQTYPPSRPVFVVLFFLVGVYSIFHSTPTWVLHFRGFGSLLFTSARR